MRIRRRITTLLAAAITVLTAVSPAFAIEPFHYRLVGDINGQWPVQMELTVEGSKISGKYWYDSRGIPIELEGVNRGGAFGMKERTADGQVTGEWVFDFNPFENEWKGTWTSADRKRTYPFHLRLLAEMVTTVEMRRGFLEVQLERPLFAEADSNQKIAAVQRAVDDQLWTSVKEDFELSPELYPDFCLIGMGWECRSRVTVRYMSDKVASMMQETYGYTGGAHGMTWHGPINLILSPAGASRISLNDIFRRGTGWEKRVSQLIVEDLRKQEAGWIVKGEVTEVDVDSLHRFTVSPAGIDFYFGPYEMGCYAEGTYMVTVPWSALKGFIDTSGPAGFLIAK